MTQKLTLTKTVGETRYTVHLYDDWYEWRMNEPGHVKVENWRYDTINQTWQQVYDLHISLGYEVEN